MIRSLLRATLFAGLLSLSAAPVQGGTVVTIVDGPDPFGQSATILVGITDGIDPIPQVTVAVHVSITDDADPVPQNKITDGADPVLNVWAEIIEGPDPIPQKGATGVTVVASIIDLPDPISASLELWIITDDPNPIGVSVPLSLIGA